jgi:hypothetical protein
VFEGVSGDIYVTYVACADDCNGINGPIAIDISEGRVCDGKVLDRADCVSGPKSARNIDEDAIINGKTIDDFSGGRQKAEDGIVVIPPVVVSELQIFHFDRSMQGDGASISEN